LIRRELTDAQWRRIEPLIPGKEGDKGRHGEDNRLFIDGVLWLVRAGAPWRDLPEEFGKWNSVFRRFRRWARKGVWKRLFTELGENPDLEYLIIDSTIVRAHQHAAGAKKGGAKMRRSGVRAAGSAPRSTSASMPSAIPSEIRRPELGPLLRPARNAVRSGARRARSGVKSGATRVRSAAISAANRAINGARSEPQGERIGVNSGTERPRPHQARRSNTNRRVDRIAIL